jgi:hypothetical protein
MTRQNNARVTVARILAGMIQTATELNYDKSKKKSPSFSNV